MAFTHVRKLSFHTDAKTVKIIKLKYFISLKTNVRNIKLTKKKIGKRFKRKEVDLEVKVKKTGFGLILGLSLSLSRTQLSEFTTQSTRSCGAIPPP